jgi:hypothetical protein
MLQKFHYSFNTLYNKERKENEMKDYMKFLIKVMSMTLEEATAELDKQAKEIDELKKKQTVKPNDNVSRET